MERIAERKIHFAPLVRQQREIDRLVRAGRYRDVTQFMRRAIDCYLDRLGRPTLTQQAQQMSEDFHHAAQAAEDRASASLQDASRSSDETW